MRPRVLSAVVGAALAAALLAPAPSGAAPGATSEPRAAQAKGSHQLLLTFDHRESLRKGTTVVDASRHHHRGTVLTEAGGRLAPVARARGRAADFPNRCRSCGRAIVEVADGRGLDPRRSAFVFGALARVTKRQAKTGANLVQKGYYNQAGGQYKLQLSPGGFPSCVVFGGRGRLKVDAPRSIADHGWHRVSCARVGTTVELRVDGKVRASATGVTGRIGNDAPLRVGGKKIAAGNKQFRGQLDNVFLRFVPKS